MIKTTKKKIKCTFKKCQNGYFDLPKNQLEKKHHDHLNLYHQDIKIAVAIRNVTFVFNRDPTTTPSTHKYACVCGGFYPNRYTLKKHVLKHCGEIDGYVKEVMKDKTSKKTTYMCCIFDDKGQDAVQALSQLDVKVNEQQNESLFMEDVEGDIDTYEVLKQDDRALEAAPQDIDDAKVSQLRLEVDEQENEPLLMEDEEGDIDMNEILDRDDRALEVASQAIYDARMNLQRFRERSKNRK